MRRSGLLPPGRMFVLAVAIVSASSGLAGQGATQPYRDPGGRFTLQYPKRDWQVFPGAGSSLATVIGNRGRASVQIEFFKLNDAIGVEENYDQIVSIESEFIRDRQPSADQIKGLPKRPDLKGIVVIEYVRPGVAGQDRIRQYSIISGATLFRVSCVAPASDFPKLESIFEQMAKSFVIEAKK